MGDESSCNQILKRKMSSEKQDLVLEFNAEQSNEMARCHPFPMLLFPAKILEDAQQ
jgi:hypothetical protein